MSRFGIYAHSLLASGGSMAIGVVTSIVVTRFLVPDARGELASLFFIATTVSSLILAGASPPRWPLQIPPPVATPNSPRQDGWIMRGQA
ncbi:MAG: hypothetical protein ACOZE7_17075 [Pseudomonadota bacterium]